MLMSEVGGAKPGAVLGEVAKPPFAVLPDPHSLFQNRAKRFATLAPGHELGHYLKFLAAVATAPPEIGPDLPPAALPSLERIGPALEHGMPPVSFALFEPDAAAMVAIEQLLDRLANTDVPAETAGAIASLRTATPDE